MILALVALLALAPIPASGVAAAHLGHCGDDDRYVYRASCGSIRVPLDWDDKNSGTIRVAFEWIPSAAGGSTKTIVAQTGGPGGASIDDGYPLKRIFGPVLSNHNLLLMDERGTGSSTAINCSALQSPLAVVPGVGDYDAQISACGRYLNHHFRTNDGRSYVHASDLFSTQQSIQDLAAIIRVLHLKPVDLFGYSYGTFFAQDFAWHFPGLIHSLILDSAYPLDQDFFDAPQRQEIRIALDTVCSRSVACAAAAPGASSERIRRLAQRLADSPLKTRSGSIYDFDLNSLLMGASVDRPLYQLRDLDAAARAWLDHADPLPLRRLFAWSTAGRDEEENYKTFSDGMESANVCTMYTTSFDMRASLAKRIREYRRSVALLPTSFFYPSAKSVADSPSYYSKCLRWPKPIHAIPSMGASSGLPTKLPILMLSGDIDITTPPGDAERSRRWLGKSVRFVTVPNGPHVSTFFDVYFCSDKIVRAFVMNSDAKLDTSCLSTIPEVRAVGVFPRKLSDQTPGDHRFGDQATLDESRLAAVAVGAVGDAIESARLAGNIESNQQCDDYFCGTGLRGGRFQSNYRATAIQLNDFAYASDSGTSGDIVITRSRGFPGAGLVIALIHIRMFDHSVAEQLTVTYDERKPHAIATIDGYAHSGHAIHESVPAP